jgi:site-specific DNA-methyltransferase (adenine-specific)
MDIDGISPRMLEAGFYNMDCMDGMAQFPDKFFELAIVDPPYAVGASDGSFGNRGYDSKTSKLKHYANHDITPDENYFKELFRVSKNWIVWGGNYYPQHFDHTGAIVWHKKTCGPLSDCEIAFQSFNKLVKYVWVEWFGFNRNGEKDSRIHPNQKPMELYKRLLMDYAKPGDKILDTHVGSASSLIACHQMGFEYWGFELDPDYFKAATERLNKVKAQVSMTELIEQVIPEQVTIGGEHEH